jgi:2',3'-cyclic-nucleotide 2'-phosphodiesterase/3'-nucleotidase/5'-nucleotidase
MIRSNLLAVALLAACTPPPIPSPAPAPTSPVSGDTLSLVLLGTTDVHGRVYNYDYYTGLATDHGLALLEPLIDSVRAAHPGRTLLFDAGDLLQGNPLGFVYAREYVDAASPIIRAMNLLRYDASALGNHEFNYGVEHLGRALSQASFPFVAANIFRAGTNEHAYRAYALLPIPTALGDTLLVGVTGNTPPGVHIWDRENITGMLDFRDVVTSVRAVVGELRQRGADVVIVLSHGGLEGTSYDTVTTRLPPENAAADLARQEPGIDMILLGHTHRELADTLINGVLLTQPKNWAASLSVARLTAQRSAPGVWRVIRKSAQLLRPHPARADRAFMDSLRWEHERTIEYVNTRVGRSSERLSAADARVRDTPIIDFINDVQRRRAGADLSATAAVSLRAEVPAGDITVAHLAALYPYDNTLRAIRITGTQLRAYLEKSAQYYAGWPAAAGTTVTNFNVPGYNFDIVSGVDYTIDISRPSGQRVTALSYNGKPVTPEQTFTLALNNYRQAGGGGFDMIAGAPVVYDRAEDVRELLIEAVRERGELRADEYFRENWRLVPEPARAAAAREQATRETVSATAPTNGHKRLRVIATNDFHGRLVSTTPSWAEGRSVGGAAVLGSYFAHERAGFNGPVVLLDGGDAMQGTPLSNLTRGRSTVEFYNLAGYSGAALGNHEFDWGQDVLRQRIRQARFPWLAANVFVTGSDTAPSWVHGTAVIDVDSVRVGLIGLVTQDTRQTTMAAHVEGLTFVPGPQIIDRWVPELRRRGVDYVIVVAHEGLTCANQTSDCSGTMAEWASAVTQRPDLIVAGHSHQVVRTRINGIPIIETGSWGTRYGVVDLHRISPDSVDVWIRGTPVAWADMVEPDTTIERNVRRVEQEIGPQLNRVIVHTAERIERGVGENPMGRLIADAQRWKSKSQIAIMNAGGVRAPLPAGAVTWGDLYQVHPFGNTLVVLELTGAVLRDALEHAVRRTDADAHVSGAVIEYDPTRPLGSRVVSIRLSDGTPVRDDQVYRVVVNDFLANGIGDGYIPFARARARYPTGVVDLEALIEYLRTLPQPIRAPADTRLRVVAR